MAARQTDHGVGRITLCQLVIFVQCRAGLADLQHQVGALHQELRVVRFERNQFLGLGQRLGKVEALTQHIGQIEPRVQVIRMELLATLQDEFRVLVFTQPRAQLGQQPHRHRIVRDGQQIGADAFFGEGEILIVVGGKRGHQPRRLAFHLAHFGQGFACARRIDLAIMRGQHFPRCG